MTAAHEAMQAQERCRELAAAEETIERVRELDRAWDKCRDLGCYDTSHNFRAELKAALGAGVDRP